jgi:hypothetical protein
LVVDLSPQWSFAFQMRRQPALVGRQQLNLAHMDWEEFASSVDVDGVFRGFD